ncbi:Rhodanese-like domain-containing protein [Mycena olivaceomarginata]|nr:Rhodanese-like domain-containing protein [Mycena olivaceomarginata]
MKYISADELANIIRSDKVPNRDYLVVDVRDDDYAGGNIKNAVNMPSREFLTGVDNLVMVFHCALSQMRGPKAARIYEETRNNSNLAQDKPQEIYVLSHGFTNFQSKYKDDPALVEKWDKEVWENAEDWS